MVYLKHKGHYTTQDIDNIEKKIYEILSDTKRIKLKEYIYGRQSDKIRGHKYVGIDKLGRSRDYTMKLPDELFNAREFTYDMYPLVQNGTMFATERRYNYLATFNVSSFLKQSQNDIRYKAIEELLRIQAQSRFTNIWRQLASVLYALDSYY